MSGTSAGDAGLRGLHHASFVVRDLEVSVAFYEALGFTLAHRWHEGPERCEVGMATPGADIELVQLDGAGIRLELIRFDAPRGRPDAPAAQDIGSAHLAFTVDDIHSSTARIAALGGRPLSEPRYDASAWWVQVLDPDGIRIELIQPLGADPS